MSENTDSPSATLETTASTGTSTGAEQGVNREGQANVATNSVPSWEVERTQLQSNLEEMRRKAENFEKGLKEYQRRTTPRLQKLSELERRLDSDTATQAELLQIRTMMNKVAAALLEDKDKNELGLELERTRLTMAQQALARQQQAAQQQAAVDSYQDPDEYKRSLFETYAPQGTSINYSDPRIDWAGDVKTLPDWVKRFSSSILAVEKAESEKKSQETIANLQRQSTDTQKSREQELTQAAEEARLQTKREEEERLRKLGVDVSDNNTGGAQTWQGNAAEVDTYLDENLLRTGAKGKIEYARRERELRAKLFG